ncbi:uncharacterized protein LOC126744931 [Anthonomus grandis grandis]|uniref:uncharacterized protein LOC126744931 n=1 Tax=Anthonomus grandis grandis TaxID=2921223 RepID=UPI0021667188|nr:uncharacterized protein LOC126744931 [Anthonomus grandis grandis]
MSYKSNGIKLTKCDSQQWKTASMLENNPPSVKFAGEEAKDRLYEPKHKKKLVRVLTVVAYVFFVSLAAIMLSLYYVFLWNGEQRGAAKVVERQVYTGSRCDSILTEMQRHFKLMESQRLSPVAQQPTTAKTIAEYDDFNNFEQLRSGNVFFKKLISDYTFNDSD